MQGKIGLEKPFLGLWILLRLAPGILITGSSCSTHTQAFKSFVQQSSTFVYANLVKSADWSITPLIWNYLGSLQTHDFPHIQGTYYVLWDLIYQDDLVTTVLVWQNVAFLIQIGSCSWHNVCQVNFVVSLLQCTNMWWLLWHMLH